MNQSVSFGERLRGERVRLGLNQSEFGQLVGVTKKTQMLYEADERSPDSKYMAAAATAGADVLYILTGMPNTVGQAVQQIKDSGRLGDFSSLTNTVGDAPLSMPRQANSVESPLDAQMWMDCYRKWSPEVKMRELRRAMGVSPSATDQPDLQQPAMGNNNQVNSAPGAVQIKGRGNFVMPRRK